MSCSVKVPGIDSPGVHMENNEFRYEATGQRYTPNEEGLTLASCVSNPRRVLTKAMDMLQFDTAPELEEEGEGEGHVWMETEEVVGGAENERESGGNQGEK